MRDTDALSNTPYSVIEGPAWGDAKFCGKWLTSVAEAEVLWRKALDEPKFSKEIDRLIFDCIPDFAIAAILLLSKLWNNRGSLVVDLWDWGGEEFVMMVGIGLFVLSDGRYRMAIPKTLRLENIKTAAATLARTEDLSCHLHPQDLVAHMPKDQALACSRGWRRRPRR